MRRKDLEMSDLFGYEVIDKARYGVLSTITKEAEPYAVPLSIARIGKQLYFHSARQGKKVENIADGSKVWVVFVGDYGVPKGGSDEEFLAVLDNPVALTRLSNSVFTTEYESAMVSGVIREVNDEDEIILGLRTIGEKYTPDKMRWIDQVIERNLARVKIYRIDIDDITAKRKQIPEDLEAKQKQNNRLEK